MNVRRSAMLLAVLTVAAFQVPTAASAQSWSFFDWVRPYPAGSEWGQPYYPAATPAVVTQTPAPRRQRVATVAVPEPVRRPPPRVLVVGIGF